MPDRTSRSDDHDLPRDMTPRHLCRLQGTVRTLDAVSRSVFSSSSWRVGQRLANLLRRFGMRIPVSGAEAEMQRLIDELKEIAELPDLNRKPAPDDVVLGRHFRVSSSRPRRYPVAPQPRPANWHLASETLPSLDAELAGWEFLPLFSLVVPVHDTRREWLLSLIDSVRAQFYKHWELVLVDDHSTRPETLEVLSEATADPMVRVLKCKSGRGISAATNAGITAAEGDYAAFVDHDDLLEPDALLQVARAIVQTGADIVYTDEDKIDEAGKVTYDPHYKPAWSPERLLAQNYVSHLTVIRSVLLELVGPLNSELDGSQDHDLVLRCAEHAKEIVHVPLPLYHWRAVAGSTARDFGEKSASWEAGRKAVENALDRLGIAGTARLGERPGTFRVTRRVMGDPMVSILVPFRDHPRLLRQCIRSVLERTGYTNFEIIGLDNESIDPATLSLMRELSECDDRVSFHRYDQPFNFSAINNFGARLARGRHLVLLNNDTEIISGQWLSAMLAQSQREEVGAVGAKLLYPNQYIQHAGVVIGLGGVAGHSHKNMPNQNNGYFSRPHVAHNVSAVTGACLMVEKAIYDELEGLDERHLAIAFNDVDFCLRLRKRGLLNIYEPAAVLYHHESISRGYEDSPEKQLRFRKEIEYMHSKHDIELSEPDPYSNPNLDSMPGQY